LLDGSKKQLAQISEFDGTDFSGPRRIVIFPKIHPRDDPEGSKAEGR
jgi:hypothetical protein